MHALVHPWTLGFMQHALLELVLVGIAGGVLGCWIVLYELSYSAESLAHEQEPASEPFEIRLSEVDDTSDACQPRP